LPPCIQDARTVKINLPDQKNTMKDFIYHMLNTFWPVITDIIGYCYNYMTRRTEVEVSPLKIKVKILLVYQMLDNKMYINTIVKMLQCPGDTKRG